MNNIKIRPVGQPKAPVTVVKCKQGKRVHWKNTLRTAKLTAIRRGYVLVGLRQQ